jgi:hypothetical protein
MHRSRFACFIASIVSIALAFVDAFLRIPFIDHRTHLDLQGAAVDAKSLTLLQRAKAFASRAFSHERYSAGRFDLTRSTFA